MLSENYLQQGLVGLGRSTDNWGQAHYGAAVIAAYFFCEENQLDGRTLKAVKVQTDQLIAKHNALFVPFAPQEPHPELLPNILTALNENIGELHGIGLGRLNWRPTFDRILDLVPHHRCLCG